MQHVVRKPALAFMEDVFQRGRKMGFVLKEQQKSRSSHKLELLRSHHIGVNGSLFHSLCTAHDCLTA